MNDYTILENLFKESNIININNNNGDKNFDNGISFNQ